MTSKQSELSSNVWLAYFRRGGPEVVPRWPRGGPEVVSRWLETLEAAFVNGPFGGFRDASGDTKKRKTCNGVGFEGFAALWHAQARTSGVLNGSQAEVFRTVFDATQRDGVRGPASTGMGRRRATRRHRQRPLGKWLGAAACRPVLQGVHCGRGVLA